MSLLRGEGVFGKRNGSITVILDPLSSSDLILICPLMEETRRATSSSPSPVPLIRRCDSRRKSICPPLSNVLNMDSRVRSEIPTLCEQRQSAAFSGSYLSDDCTQYRSWIDDEVISTSRRSRAKGLNLHSDSYPNSVFF